MLGPFATASRLTPIHQMSLVVLSRAACASMSTTSTTTTTTTTTTTRDRGDRYGPIEWAQLTHTTWHFHLLVVSNVSPCVARVWRILSIASCLSLSSSLQNEYLRNSQKNVSLRFWLLGCCVRDSSPSTDSRSVTQTETRHMIFTLLIVICSSCCRWSSCCLVAIKQVLVRWYSATIRHDKPSTPSCRGIEAKLLTFISPSVLRVLTLDLSIWPPLTSLVTSTSIVAAVIVDVATVCSVAACMSFSCIC